MGDGFRGVAPPTGPGVPIFDVVAPRPGESYDLTLLDGAILGTSCHWVVEQPGGKGQSRICTYEEGDCQWCGKQRSLWLGWLGVINNGSRSRAILRLGCESARALVARAAPHVGLRGLRLKVWRSAQGQTAALFYEESPLPAPRPVPDPHPIEPTICLVLGCASLPEYRLSREDVEGVPL